MLTVILQKDMVNVCGPLWGCWELVSNTRTWVLFLLRAAQEYEGTAEGGHLQPPQPHPWLPSPLQPFLKEIPSSA